MGAHALRAGGTSVASSRPSSTLITAIAAVATAAVAIAVWFFVNSGESPDRETAAEGEAATRVDTEVRPAATRAPAVTAQPRVRPQPRPQQDDRLADAVGRLSAELQSRRLWSNVSLDRAQPTVVIVQSSLCEDRDMQQVVADFGKDLAANGATAVRCVAPHGGVIFEKAP